MSSKGIWFLPRPGKDTAPVFTFTEDSGPLQLGTVLEHFNDPSSVLFFPPKEVANPPIDWPEVSTPGTEKDHEHTDSSTSSVGGTILAQFLNVAKAKSEVEVKRERLLKLGKVDHKIVQYKYPFTRATVQAILKQEAVRELNSGLFRWFLPKPIYVVSGLRIATASFTVTEENKPEFSASAEASLLSGSTNNQAETAPAADGDAGNAPVAGEEAANALTGAATTAATAAVSTQIPVGGTIQGHISGKNTITHQYETMGEGVVFAYCMHVIRQRASLFADSSAFMTDDGDGEGEEGDEIECVELTNAEELKDLKDMKRELIKEVAEGVFVYGG